MKVKCWSLKKHNQYKFKEMYENKNNLQCKKNQIKIYYKNDINIKYIILLIIT